MGGDGLRLERAYRIQKTSQQNQTVSTGDASVYGVKMGYGVKIGKNVCAPNENKQIKRENELLDYSVDEPRRYSIN